MRPSREGENMPDETTTRKLSHIRTTLREPVQSHVPTGFDDVYLVHKALPEINRSEIDLSTDLFGHRLRAPVIIESMTGGTPKAAKINKALAKAAEKLELAMGVGSQRAALENPRLAYTYSVTRENAPTAPLFANLGCPQIIRKDGLESAKAAVEMIKADGLFIHLNAVQESVQFEGETNFAGVIGRIREIANALSVPVLVKETGAGISRETAQSLERVGVKGVNVSGLGGTSWSAVEYYRAREKGYKLQTQLGQTFWDWGIPTVPSIVEVSTSTRLKVFASGGVRNGLHIAKSIALGAHYGGLALPLLKSLSSRGNGARDRLLAVIEELKTAMFLTGSRNVEDLRSAPLVITGRTADWLHSRGIDIKNYASR